MGFGSGAFVLPDAGRVGSAGDVAGVCAEAGLALGNGVMQGGSQLWLFLAVMGLAQVALLAVPVELARAGRWRGVRWR